MMLYNPREKPKAKHRIKGLEDYDVFYFFPVVDPGIIIFERLPDPHTIKADFIEIIEHPKCRICMDTIEDAIESKVMRFEKKIVCNSACFKYVWVMPLNERYLHSELVSLFVTN